MQHYEDCPRILRDFLHYHETVRGHSKKTVDEYYLDLRTFFRYIKKLKKKAPADAELNQITITDVDIELIRSITLSDVYDYLGYLSRERATRAGDDRKTGLSAAARARKVASIKSFFKYLTNKVNLLDENPVSDLDSPRLKKSLPRYLTLEESTDLLSSVDGDNAERDFCILTLFLNCGLRISELVNINLSDIMDNTLRVLGKGNKERIVYLNDSCLSAINDYKTVRLSIPAIDKNAFFISKTRRKRLSANMVHRIVKKHLAAAGLDETKYSSHKLRHTAATLMLQNGVDVRTLQEVLGHEHLNTTQIYTHVDNENLRTAANANPLASFKPRNKKPIKED